MRTPSAKQGTKSLLGLSIYTGAQLEAKTETKDLAVMLEKAEAELSLADAAYAASSRSVLVQQALRAQSDRQANGVTKTCYLAVCTADGSAGGKAGPKQSLYFPSGLLGLTRASIDRQPGGMAILAGRLASDEDPAIAGHATAINAAGDALGQAVQAYDIALQSTQIAYGQLLKARETWIRLYEPTNGELVTRVGKRAADAFFKAPKKPPKPKAPVLPAPPPAPAPPV